MRTLIARALVAAALAGAFYLAAPLAAPWFSERFLPSRLDAAAFAHLDRLNALHRRGAETLRELAHPVAPGWGTLASRNARLADGSFILVESSDGRPLAWAGDPRDLGFTEGVRAAFPSGRTFLVHCGRTRWGRLTVAQPAPDFPRRLFVRAMTHHPVTLFPSLPTPNEPGARTYLFKPAGGPPVLSLALRGVSADRALLTVRRSLGGLLAAAWLLLLAVHRRSVPRWAVPPIARAALLAFPFGLLPLPPSWISASAFSLPRAAGLAGSPLDAALTLFAIALALGFAPWRRPRGWGAHAAGCAAGGAALLAASLVIVGNSPLGAVPFPLRLAMPFAAWTLGAVALHLRPKRPIPPLFPWLILALGFLPFSDSVFPYGSALLIGSFGLVCWRREAFVPAVLAALWGLALPHALEGREWMRYLAGPHGSLRLQRPALEVLELGESLPLLMDGWDWRDRPAPSPASDDGGAAAEALASGLGLEGRGVDYSIAVFRADVPVSLCRNAQFPPKPPGAGPVGTVRNDPRESDLYGGEFALKDDGRPWGTAVVQFRPRSPTSPEGGALPLLLGLYDKHGSLMESGSVFLPPSLPPGRGPDLPGWARIREEGERRALFFLPAWEFPFPHLPFAFFLLAGALLSIPRPFDPRGLLGLVMLPLATLLVLAAALAFVFTARQERDLRSLQNQWTGGAQKNLLDEAVGVLPDLVYRDGVQEGGTESAPSLRYAPAELMAAPLTRPVTRKIDGRPYLFFSDTEGRLCALQQPNLPGLERPVSWLARRTWGVLLSVFAVAFMALLALLRRFTEPVALLADSARAVQRGEPFNPGALSASREINDLAGALGDAIERLRHEERALREILANLPVGVALINGGDLLFRNGPMERTGLTPEAMQALPDEGTFDSGGRLHLVRRVLLPGGRQLLLASDISAEITAQKLTAFAEIARIVAHEVKNPLTPIRLSIDYLEELAGKDAGRFQQEAPAVLREVTQSVNDLEHAAMEFADFARLPALHMAVHDLAELLSGWLAPYQASGALRYRPPAATIPIAMDPRLFKRALFNLLANAWQSASPPPPVTIRLEFAPAAVLVIVEDGGPGVPEESLPHLFEPYFTTKSSGTGLGLLIARRIVEEHGGKIEARNRPEGGLVVEIKLPLAGGSEFGVRSSE